MPKRSYSRRKKNNWKWLWISGLLALVIVAAVLVFRFVSFVGDTTDGGRTASYLEDVPDVVSATATAEASRNAVSGLFAGGLASNVVLPTATPAPTYNPNSSIVQKLRGNEPISMLLFGYGGNAHAGEWLTDTILVMTYDPISKTVFQINIPRDMYVFVPYGGKNIGKWAKINTVLASIMEWDKPTQETLDSRYRWSDSKKRFDAGVNLLADTIELIVGYRVDYWGGLSFDGFRRFIDSMGGVEVDVERYFVDKKYPRNDDDQIDASYMTVEFNPGKQTMNGERAIEYARSRYSENPLEGNDFARSRRQMRLINAVKDKAFKQNLVMKSFDYMQALQGKFRFSLSLSELTDLANFLNSSDGKFLANEIKFSSQVMNDLYLTDSLVDGEYLLTPIEGKGKYANIQRWLKRVMTSARVKGEEVWLQVLNTNGTSGLAAKMTDYFLGQGFKMSLEQDWENRDDTVLMDYTNGKASATIARLKNYLPNLKVVIGTPDKRPPATPPEVNLQLCLGKDFKGLINVANNPSRNGG